MTVSSDTLKAILVTSAALSVLGTVLQIASWAIFPEVRSFSRRILTHLAVADLLVAISWMPSAFIDVDSLPPSVFCRIQGYILQYSTLSSYLWTSCLAWHLYRTIWKRDRITRTTRYNWMGWGVPAIPIVYFFIREVSHKSSMGPTDRPWCWIQNDGGHGKWQLLGSMEQLACLYIPTLIMLGFNSSVYIFLARRVQLVLSDGVENKIKARFFLYFFVFVFVLIWGLLHRVYQVFSRHHRPSDALLILEVATSPAQGLLNSLVYGLNPRVRDKWRELFGCKRRTGRSLLLSHGGGELGDVSDGSYGTLQATGPKPMTMEA